MKQKKKGNNADMTRIFGATVALAILVVFLSSAQAAIKIEIAEVQKRVRVYQGKQCSKERSDHLGWECRNNSEQTERWVFV
jgi:hypothetical protein